MQLVRRSVCMVMLVLFGCGSDAPGDVTPSERFVGPWFVEETEAHALYGASTYELAADGTMTLVWDAGLMELPQGHVRSPDRTRTCRFGTTWQSRGDGILVIDGACSDDAHREIALAFASDPSLNAIGANVEIISVGGEDGWLPPAFGWSFRKCATATDAPCE